MVKGSGNVISEVQSVGEFDKITVSGWCEVEVEQSDENRVVVKADDNILPLLLAENRGGELEIGIRRGVSLDTKSPIKYTIKVKKLSDISILGSGEIRCSKLYGDRLNVSISGNGKTNLTDMDIKDLHISLQGSGKVKASGVSERLYVSISGHGTYYGDRLRSQQTEIDISGHGKANVWVETSLRVSGHGNGTVTYRGNPESVDTHGSIRVKKD